MTQKPLYKVLANAIGARKRCHATENPWFEKWSELIDHCEKEHLPSGSGIDSGTKVDSDRSTDEKIVLTSSYHAMDENGYYDGWIDFTVTVKPSLIHNIILSITRRFGKYTDLKEYLYDVFNTALTAEVNEFME